LPIDTWRVIDPDSLLAVALFFPRALACPW